jgi:hypothetical protein
MAVAVGGGAATSHESSGPRSTDWARKYPPLVALIIGVVIALAILPSALNLPQSNPQETVEYAPVPPNDDSNNNNGNMSGLGLAGSASIGTEFSVDDAPPARPTSGPPGHPRNAEIQCFGKNPPRQTEDRLAPPCVAYFGSDNFGATYQGVTRDEIRVLFYLDGGILYVGGSDPSTQGAPSSKCFDLFERPDPKKTEHLTVKALRTWQTYFNSRFQTYRRKVHLYVCFSGGSTPENRRQDAQKHFNDIKPFATVLDLTEGSEDDYIRTMARKGVLNFGSFSVRPASLFQDFGKMIWSFLPSVEQQAESYASYVCQKLVPNPAALASPDFNGKKRKFGMVHTTDDGQPGLQLIADLVKQKVKACGAEMEEPDAVYSYCCIARGNTASTAGEEVDMARFRRDGVSTILWTGGINPHYGEAAQNIGYTPEWIILGDSIMDAPYPITFSDHASAFDGHAIAVTPQPWVPGLKQQQCYQAFRSVNKTYPDSDLAYTCNYYRDLFQLFVGIQVAGPRLGPTSVDQGFHSIPQRYDGTPEVPACFYLPGDYTCVKDAQVQIFDASSNAPGDSRPGCWRSIEGGKRYAPWKWPAGNIDAQFGPNQPCSGYNSRVRYNIS